MYLAATVIHFTQYEIELQFKTKYGNSCWKEVQIVYFQVVYKFMLLKL